MSQGQPPSDSTYSSHSKVSEYTSCYASHDAAILDLGWSGVAVHPGQLELRIGTYSFGEGHVSDHVSECLSRVDISATVVIAAAHRVCLGVCRDGSSPFLLMLFKHFPFGVISDDPNIDEATQVELLCSKLGHVCSGSCMLNWKAAGSKAQSRVVVQDSVERSKLHDRKQKVSRTLLLPQPPETSFSISIFCLPQV